MKCMHCGKEMDNTSGGNFNCPSCGSAVNDLVYKGTVTKPETNIGNYGSPIFGQTGWICPRCGRDVRETISQREINAIRKKFGLTTNYNLSHNS